MSEIKCPKCGEVFTVDESSYADIVKQVRDEQFNAELAKHEELLRSQARQAAEQARLEAEKAAGTREAGLNEVIAKLQAEVKAAAEQRELAERAATEQAQRQVDAARSEGEARVAELEAQLLAAARERELAEQAAGEQAQRRLQEALAERDAKMSELEAKLGAAAEARASAVSAARAEAERAATEQAGASQREIERLQAELRAAQAKAETDLARANADAEHAVETLKAQLSGKDSESAQALEVQRAEAQRQAAELRAEVDKLRGEVELARTQATAEAERRLQGELSERDARIASMEQQLKGAESAQELAVTAARSDAERAAADAAREAERRAEDALRAAERERDAARSELTQERALRDAREQQEKVAHENALMNLRNANTEIIRMKDEEIERLKEMKSLQSTKMVGESLERHCENEFNKVRMTAFPRAYFEKDNEVIEGGKGDFVFRENDEQGNEILSIMFEMKNEMDTTATKHKNEDFFKKLDADRKKKGCEYAVLVSLLEQDSDYYNTGIVDVSYRYEKMYVIRPQFFIPMITLLRNAAMNALSYKQELAEIRQRNIDVTGFESKMEEFKTGFEKNYDAAHRKFDDAIKEIDKTIDHLNKVKDNLVSSDRQLRLANDKAQKLSIRRLTHKNPTMKALFDEARVAEAAVGLPMGAESSDDTNAEEASSYEVE